MKLNHDCLRDVLLVLEDELALDDTMQYEDLWIGDFVNNKSLCSYTKIEIAYSVYKLSEAGYLSSGAFYSTARNSSYYIRTVTFYGHEFIDSIRDETRWNGIKKGLSAVRDYSLSAISSIAEGMTSGAVAAYLAQK